MPASRARPLRQLHASFLVALAAHDGVIAEHVRTVECQGLRDPATSREEKEDKGTIAQFLWRVAAERCRQGRPVLVINGLRQAFTELGQVDRAAEVGLEPRLVHSAEPQEAPERDQPALAG